MLVGNTATKNASELPMIVSPVLLTVPHRKVARDRSCSDANRKLPSAVLSVWVQKISVHTSSCRWSTMCGVLQPLPEAVDQELAFRPISWPEPLRPEPLIIAA